MPLARAVRPAQTHSVAESSAGTERTRHTLAGGLCAHPATPVGRACARRTGTRHASRARPPGRLLSGYACRPRAHSPAPPASCWPRPSRADCPRAPPCWPPCAPSARGHLWSPGSRLPPGACPRRCWPAGRGHHGPDRARGSCGGHARGGPTISSPPVSLAPWGPRYGQGPQLHRSPLMADASHRTARHCAAPSPTERADRYAAPLRWRCGETSTPDRAAR